MKRGSANMWWIIIGAVIALVVMIILMVMFTGKTQPLEKGLSSCESKGGACATDGTPCPTNTFASSAFDCEADKSICCIGSPKACVDENSCATGQSCDKTYGTQKYCYTPK
jgi:hypothetical protein